MVTRTWTPSTPASEESAVGVSEKWSAAWQYTRLISPHDEVKKSDRDVYGVPTNDYHLAHAIGPVAPLAPWAIHLSGRDLMYRLLNFDFDVAGGSPDEVEAAQDDADAFSILLGQLSIVHLVCESSSKGGRHVWVGLADPAAASLVKAIGEAAKAILPSLDWGMLANAAHGAARPPLSPHRNGSFSRPVRGSLDALLMPSTTTADLEQLLAALYERSPEHAPASAPAESTSSNVLPMPPRAEALRGRGADHLNTPGGGENPSWTGWMCLLHMASAGWSFQAVQSAARTAPGMETYRTRRAGNHGERRPRAAADSERRLEAQWEKAQARATVRRAAPPARVPRDVGELVDQVAIAEDLLERLRVNPGRWGGRYGAPTRKTVLKAIAYLMLTTGKRHVAAATRTVAELCNIDQSTAARALLQLQEEGWVARTSQAEGINAASWSLTLPGHFSTASDLGATQPLKNSPPPAEIYTKRARLLEVLESDLASLQHDVFTYQGLGHLAGQVWSYLRGREGQTVAEISRFVGIGFGHAAHLLSRLRTLRLLRKSDGGWAASLRDLRNHAAQVLGVDGTITRRHERYEDDRQLWRWWRAEHERMLSRPSQRPRHRHVTERPLTWFEAEATGEWTWPLYPRVDDDPSARADHRRAREDVSAGLLSPTSKWQLPRAA